VRKKKSSLRGSKKGGSQEGYLKASEALGGSWKVPIHSLLGGQKLLYQGHFKSKK